MKTIFHIFPWYLKFFLKDRLSEVSHGKRKHIDCRFLMTELNFESSLCCNASQECTRKEGHQGLEKTPNRVVTNAVS